MIKKILAFVFIISAVVQTNAQCEELFFSEYLEGSSNNRALEVFNPTNSTINLSDYRILRANNGSPVAQDSLQMSGMLPPGAVYVVANPSADPLILAVADTLHTVTFFNGDDALQLRKISNMSIIDVIGILGVDPGTNWIVGAGATSEFTLVRKISVQDGTSNWAVAATQYDEYPQNTFTYLGNHSMTPCCPLVNASLVSLQNVLCFGDSNGVAEVTGGVDPVTYQWFPYGGTTASADSLIADTFYCVLTSVICPVITDTLHVIITQPSPINPVLQNLTHETCNANNAALSINVSGGVGGYSYLWNNGHTTSSPSGLDAGNYNCEITDTNGCVVYFSETLLSIPPATVALSLNVDSICYAPMLVTLSGESPLGGTYSGTGVSSNQFDMGMAGLGWTLITYTFTDTNSCIGSAYDSIWVQTTSANLSLPGADSVCANVAPFNLIGGSPAGGMYTGTGVSSGQFNPATANVGWNIVTYTYTDPNTCVANVTDSIYVRLCSTAGIPNQSSNTFQIYPNPGTGPFTIEIPNGVSVEGTKVSILTSLGQTIFTAPCTGKIQYIHPGNLSAGIYFIQLSAEGYQEVVRYVVSN